MSDERLVKLAQDLEWLGCEASFYSQKSNGMAAEMFLEKQRALMSTADKIERELKGAVRFNLKSLVGVEYPLDWTLDSITNLLAALEAIKQSAVHSADDLPPRVRQFSRMVDTYVQAALPLTA